MPVREKPEDRKNEKLVAQRYRDIKYPGMLLHKNPEFYPIDFNLVGKPGLGVPILQMFEVKCRDNKMRKWDEFYLSAHKCLAIIQYSRVLGFETRLVVKWTDRIGVIDLAAFDVTSFQKVWFGRLDRNDPNDVEPGLAIPVNLFEEIGL